MGYDNEKTVLPRDRNFQPHAIVWRANIGSGKGLQTEFGTFESPTGRSEVEFAQVLTGRLPNVYVAYLPIQWDILSGRGDMPLTVEEPIDPTLLKPLDQMTLDELKERGLKGISVDTGTTFQAILPDGKKIRENLLRYYPHNSLTDLTYGPTTFRLGYINKDGKPLSATYNRKIAMATAIMHSSQLPSLYYPPQEPAKNN